MPPLCRKTLFGGTCGKNKNGLRSLKDFVIIYKRNKYNLDYHAASTRAVAVRKSNLYFLRFYIFTRQ